MSKPHKIKFFLYFPSHAVAEQAARELKAKGFGAKVERDPDEGAWLCVASKKMVPDLAILSKLRRDFNEMASSKGGRYDAWGTTVVK